MKLGKNRLIKNYKVKCPQVQTDTQLPFGWAIMVIVHWTLPIFKLGREFDKSNQYMKFGRNRVINDEVRKWESAN